MRAQLSDHLFLNELNSFNTLFLQFLIFWGFEGGGTDCVTYKNTDSVTFFSVLFEAIDAVLQLSELQRIIFNNNKISFL